MVQPWRYYSPSMMARAIAFGKQLVGYQLMTAVFAIPTAVIAGVLTVVLAPDAIPTFTVAVLSFIVFKTALLVREVNRGDLPPPSEAEASGTVTETAVSVVLETVYVTTLVGSVVAIVTVGGLGLVGVYLATFGPAVDLLLLHRRGVSPAALPIIAGLSASHAIGLLRDVNLTWLRGFGFGRPPRRSV